MKREKEFPANDRANSFGHGKSFAAIAGGTEMLRISGRGHPEKFHRAACL